MWGNWFSILSYCTGSFCQVFSLNVDRLCYSHKYKAKYLLYCFKYFFFFPLTLNSTIVYTQDSTLKRYEIFYIHFLRIKLKTIQIHVRRPDILTGNLQVKSFHDVTKVAKFFDKLKHRFLNWPLVIHDSVRDMQTRYTYTRHRNTCLH